VGADAFFLAVAGGPEVDDLLEVAPAALDFQELLVPQSDVLGGQLRVGAAEQVLAVEVLLGLDGGCVEPQQPAGDYPQVAVQARLGSDGPAQLGPLGLGELVAVLDHLVEVGEHPRSHGGVPLRRFGVIAARSGRQRWRAPADATVPAAVICCGKPGGGAGRQELARLEAELVGSS
jgi:hypothetical protein